MRDQAIKTWCAWEQSQRLLFIFPQRPRHPVAPSSTWFELPLQQFCPSFENFSCYNCNLTIIYFSHVLKLLRYFTALERIFGGIPKVWRVINLYSEWGLLHLQKRRNSLRSAPGSTISVEGLGWISPQVVVWLVCISSTYKDLEWLKWCNSRSRAGQNQLLRPLSHPSCHIVKHEVINITDNWN